MGYAATRTDFDIPRDFGVLQTIGDTIGIGGIMRGLRTIPLMIEMGDEMAVRCPEGLVLNYTNPMAMVPWGIWAGSAWPAARTLGVCHSVRDTHSFLARTVGIDEADIEFRTAGFNHQCFVYVFRDRRTGEDLYPRLREIVDADPEGSRTPRARGAVQAVRLLPDRILRARRGVRAVVPARSRARSNGSGSRSTSTSAGARTTSASGRS